MPFSAVEWLTRNFSFYNVQPYTQVTPWLATLGGQSALLIMCCQVTKGGI